MCGICGELHFDAEKQADSQLLGGMLNTIRHRGPDDTGKYVSGPVALGHSRLSIIDLNTGKQPISNEDGTIWIVFNGEIYNFRALRELLIGKGHRFSTATDTEVIIHLYEEYGDACVQHLEGMFAFAVWDEKRRRLLIARDRVGIKPLYYFVIPSRKLLFASEMKALRVDPACPADVDVSVIDRFLKFKYSPGVETPLRDIRKLEPGHYLTAADGIVKVHEYWDLKFPQKPRAVSFDQAQGELLVLLEKTIAAHMISDVPVGVLLSGGVDSSGVLSIATRHSDNRIHAFTVGFEDDKLIDERSYASRTARQLGADFHETSMGAQDFGQFLPKYVWHMEDLVCEPPAIALYFVTKLARDHGVKVLLSGEGGDEAFAGYNTYRNILRLERIRQLGPPWSQMAGVVASRFGRLTGRADLLKASEYLRAPSGGFSYMGRTAGHSGHFGMTDGTLYSDDFRHALASSFSNSIKELAGELSGATPLSQMLYVDTKTWLPDDLLVKADKISMANSVELRVPLLDHKVLEFAASLPDNFKVRGSQTKYVLKEALRGRVSSEVLQRKKAGFPVPVSRWLRRELWGQVQEIMNDSRTYTRGYFDRKAVDRILNEHRSQGTRGGEVFSLLVLELWHRQFVDCDGTSISGESVNLPLSIQSV